MHDPLIIAGRAFGSRLVVGTGKYPSHEVMRRAHDAAGTEMVTVAVRRVDLTDKGPGALLSWIDRSRVFLLPRPQASSRVPAVDGSSPSSPSRDPLRAVRASVLEPARSKPGRTPRTKRRERRHALSFGASVPSLSEA